MSTTSTTTPEGENISEGGKAMNDVKKTGIRFPACCRQHCSTIRKKGCL